MHITAASKHRLCNIYMTIMVLWIMNLCHQLKSHKLQQFNASLITNNVIITSCDPLHILERTGVILWWITYVMFIIRKVPTKHFFQFTQKSTTI